MEYCLAPVTTHTKDPPRRMNIEKIVGGMANSHFTTWTLFNNRYTDASLGLPGCLSQESSVPSMGGHSKHFYIRGIPSSHLVL